MLSILWAQTDEEAEELAGKEYLWFPDMVFREIVKEGEMHKDELFLKILKDIDRADMPFMNVVRDLRTGMTHDIFKVSTGTKMLWMTLTDKLDNYLIATRWFGENCFKFLFEYAHDHDILLYDDSSFLVYPELDEMFGEKIKDFRTGKVLVHNWSDIDIYAQENYGV